MAFKAPVKPVEKVAILSRQTGTKTQSVEKIAVLSTPPGRRDPCPEQSPGGDCRAWGSRPPYPWAASLTSVTSSPRECTSSST